MIDDNTNQGTGVINDVVPTTIQEPQWAAAQAFWNRTTARGGPGVKVDDLARLLQDIEDRHATELAEVNRMLGEAIRAADIVKVHKPKKTQGVPLPEGPQTL